MKVCHVLNRFCDRITLYNLSVSMRDLLDLKIGAISSHEVNLFRKYITTSSDFIKYFNAHEYKNGV